MGILPCLLRGWFSRKVDRGCAAFICKTRIQRRCDCGPVELVNYGQWINLLGYQVAWLITVTGASHGKVWPAWLASSVLCFGHLATSSWRGLDVRLIALSALLGSILDGCLVSTGILQYSTPSPAVPIVGTPLWIVALWIAFSTTLTRSLGWLRGRMGLTVIFGAVGGPLAYLAAARGWAVDYIRRHQPGGGCWRSRSAGQWP